MDIDFYAAPPMTTKLTANLLKTSIIPSVSSSWLIHFLNYSCVPECGNVGPVSYLDSLTFSLASLGMSFE